MGQAISARTDYAIDEVRGFAKRSKDAAQARRRLAIAAVLEGATRENAARIGRDGSPDAARRGDPLQLAGTGGSDQHSFAGHATQA